MRPFVKCLMLTGLLAGCDAAAGPLDPASTAAPGPSLASLVSEGFVVTEPFSEVFDNPCNGTAVLMTGEIVHTFHGVTDSPGSGLFLHLKDTFRITATGLGDDGTEYVFTDMSTEIFQSPSPPAPQFTFTAFADGRIVSKGPSPNFMVGFRFHVTVTPDGTFKVTSEVEHVDCRG